MILEYYHQRFGLEMSPRATRVSHLGLQMVTFLPEFFMMPKVPLSVLL